MSVKTALGLVTRVEAIIDDARSLALKNDVGSAWDRDKEFLAQVRGDVESGSPDRMQSVLDKMRNLSQGFGSYCGDLTDLDRLLDELYAEIQALMISYR